MADHSLPLRLWALGPPEVHLGDNLATFPTRKTLALLIYLAIEAGAQPREHLGPCCGQKLTLSAVMPICATHLVTCKQPWAKYHGQILIILPFRHQQFAGL